MNDLVKKQQLTPYLLLAHSWAGCDTTSAVQKQEKLKIIQLLKLSQVQESGSCFVDVFAAAGDVGKSGIEIYVKR